MFDKSKTTTIALLSALIVATVTSMASAKEIVIVGTGDGTAVLKSIGAAFSTANPGVTISVPKSIGSGGAIKSVGNDKNIIGRVARGIKNKEKGYGLTHVAYAKIPVVFFVNKNVGVQGLSHEQVAGIYSGKITNWKDVGGKDAKIRVVRREDGDSSLSVLKKTLPGFGDIKITSKSKEVLNTTENFAIVERTKGTIGFGPYSNAKKANVTILKINGLASDAPDYPSVTKLGFVFKDGSKTGDIKKFIEFATSDAAHASIKKAYGFPAN